MSNLKITKFIQLLDSCLNVKCPWGARCENGECVCPTECPMARIGEDSICGSDGVLYKSTCYMLKAACEKSMIVRQVDRDMCPAEFSSALTLYKPVVSELLMCLSETVILIRVKPSIPHVSQHDIIILYIMPYY